MSRPLLELADLVRTAGVAFLWRNRQWIRWTHIKVLLAIARCRTAAIGTAQSVRRLLGNGGSPRAEQNFCPRATSMLSSPYPMSWRRSPCRTTKILYHLL